MHSHEPEHYVDQKRNLMIIGIIAIFIAIGLLFSGCSQKLEKPSIVADTTSSVEVIAPSTKSAQEEQQEIIVQAIADGVYIDNVTYRSPGGLEKIEISVSVEGDVITAASINAIIAGPKSSKYIAGVNDALPELVIGKKITELNLPVQISGSSLTSAAFKAHVSTLVESY